MSDELKCREFVEFIIDYLEDALDPAVGIEFERHIAKCKSCEDYLRTYRDTITLARSICPDCEDAPPPEDVPEDLIKAILAARKRQ